LDNNAARNVLERNIEFLLYFAERGMADKVISIIDEVVDSQSFSTRDIEALVNWVLEQMEVMLLKKTGKTEIQAAIAFIDFDMKPRQVDLLRVYRRLQEYTFS